MNDPTPKPEAAGTSAQDRTLQEFLGAPPPSRFGPWRKWIIIGAIALIAVLVLWYFLRADAATSYATQDVERGNLTVTVSATGNLQPTNQVQVGSEQSGLVTDVYVENNDQVTKGQPLARLDTSRLRDTITQNQASVAAAQASVAQANASAVQARANLNRLEEVYRLSGGKVPSKTELDTGRAENLRAIAQVRAAQAEVTQARAILSSSLTNLAKATIYSPVNGVVLLRQIDPGQTVAASFQAPVLFTIAEDLSQMKLEVKVDEADVGQVKEGQQGSFTVDAYPGRTFPAVISRIDVGSSTSATTGAQGNANTVVSYMADLAVQNPDLTLRPGMTATADIVTMQKCNVLLIPNAALRFDPNTPVATAPSGMPGAMPIRPGAGRQRPERQVRIGRGSRQTVHILGSNGQPQAVRVIVGNTNGALTEVIGGLKPGQKVITSRLAAGTEQAAGTRQGAGQGGGAGARGQGQGRGRGQSVCVEDSGAGVPAQGRRPEGQASEGRNGLVRAQAVPQAAAGSPQGPRSLSGGGGAQGLGAPGDRTGAANAGGAGSRANMSPEERAKRRAAFQNASPEERERMRAQFGARRRQGGAPAPAGE